MNDDEQWFRDTLAPGLDVLPPPDLADRAERAAGRIRRRRAGLAALVAAAAVAVPLAAHGLRSADRAAVIPAGPGPTASTAPTADPATCTIDVPAAPAPRLARSAADAAWPYRGDPGLRDDAVRAGTQARLTEVRPLFGITLDGDVRLLVFAGRRDDGRWQWQYTVDGAALPGPDSPATGGGGTELLPVLDGRTQLSLLLQTRSGAAPWLLVLAPGARQIDYTFCARDGQSFLFSVEDDTFLQQVSAGGGVIEVRAADGQTLEGPVTVRWPG